MPVTSHVLYVGPDTPASEDRVGVLETTEMTVHSARGPLDGLKWLQDGAVDCVVADASLHDLTISSFKDHVHNVQPNTPVLFVGDIESSVVGDEAIEYVPSGESLATTVERIVSRRRVDGALSQYRTLRDAVLAISRAIPTTDSRETIEELVFDHLRELDRYLFIRIGDYADDTDMLHFRVPMSVSIPATDIPPAGATDDTAFVARAVATREAVAVHGAARQRHTRAPAPALDIDGGSSEHVTSQTTVTSAAVPFVRDGSVNGLLLIIADGEATVGRPERELLTDLGRIVGQALDRVAGENGMPPEEFENHVVHELVNPLNIARAHLNEIRNTEDTANLDRVEHALEQMEHILTDEVALFRGQTIDEMTTRDLASDASEAWASVETPAAELVVESSRRFEANHSLVTRLLANLFDNAVTAAEDVTVRVGILASGFFVEDDGPGIPASERLWIFDPVFTTNEGSGLGLAIVRRIAESHDWDITVSTGKSGGARFEITGNNFAPQ